MMRRRFKLLIRKIRRKKGLLLLGKAGLLLFIIIGWAYYTARRENIFLWQSEKFLFSLLKVGILVTFVSFVQIKYQQFKRGFDFLFATIGLIVLFPLFVIIAFLIKLDSKGSVFFRQERVGKDGKIFTMWKFRTMREYAELESGPVWAEDNDPRITRVGKFLRKSHFDELPQLINVFKGEMSLVGPRPERYTFVEMINHTIPGYKERLKVRPGITGLAQVRYKYGASVKDAAKKLKYDLIYIKKMCWLLDFQIMAWTIGKVFTGEGAR